MKQNGCMLQGFSWYLAADGKHWDRMATNAKMIAATGVTSVWLPPAYKGGGPADVGYGIYDLWDLGEFDQKGTVATKYGTKEQYLACVKAFQDEGVDVLADVVLNQRMGADESEQVMARAVNPSNRNEVISDPHEITAWTRFAFPGRRGTYDDFTWDWRCFHGVDHDDATGEDGVFLFDGKRWDWAVDGENGNFDYLMGCDVDVSDPAVYDQLVRWGKWYLDTTGVNGFRLDAVKHISRDFYLRWLTAMREHTGKELFTVGEYWSSSSDALVGYLGDSRVMSLFDVPLHFRLFQASCSNGQMDLSHLFDDTLVARDPIHAVTFVENHDTQPGQALESTIQQWFKPSAYAIILLRQEGYPCVFYGDLFGMPNDGDIKPVVEVPILMEVRRRFAYGEQHDYFDDPNLIGWTREGVDEMPCSGCAALLTDGARGEKTMYVGTRHAGEQWRCIIGEEASVVVAEDGTATFGVGDGRLSVYLSVDATKMLENDFTQLIRHSAAAVNPQPKDEERAAESARDRGVDPEAEKAAQEAEAAADEAVAEEETARAKEEAPA